MHRRTLAPHLPARTIRRGFLSPCDLCSVIDVDIRRSCLLRPGLGFDPAPTKFRPSAFAFTATTAGTGVYDFVTDVTDIDGFIRTYLKPNRPVVIGAGVGNKGSGPLLAHLFPASAKKWTVKTMT